MAVILIGRDDTDTLRLFMLEDEDWQAIQPERPELHLVAAEIHLDATELDDFPTEGSHGDRC
jgi:hypothetical protein